MEETLSKNAFKLLCKLNNKKYRDEKTEGFDILIEGERLISQVIDYSVKIKALYTSENISKFHDLDSRKYYITEKQAEMLTETENSQGIFAQVTFQTTQITMFNRLVYLNGISDPGNMGTIIRAAVAFGVDGVIVDDLCCDISNSKVVRASMGAVFKQPILKVKQGWLSERKETIVISEIDNGTPLNEFKFPDSPYILVIGNEANGVCENIRLQAAHRVYIPMQNSMESLNVAVAAGILMYKLGIRN